jgi:hypothetical protein
VQDPISKKPITKRAGRVVQGKAPSSSPSTAKKKKRVSNPISKWANDLNRHLSKEVVEMSNKYMEKQSAFLAVLEMQIKTKLKFNLTSIRTTIINASKNRSRTPCGTYL